MAGAERFVVDCKTCGYHQEYGLATLASEDAREHRARMFMPGKPRHEVAALPKSVYERGERELRALAAAAETASRPGVAAAPVSGFATWTSYYAGFGFRLTPIHPPCASCRQEPAKAHECEACGGGKKPILRGWQEGGPLSEDANVGIVCGSPSGGLAVLDFDTPDDLQRVLGTPPEEVAQRTLVVKTGRGYHVYVRAPGFGRSRHIQGILVRGEGGQVVAPPSVHATGVQYAFLGGLAVVDRLVAPAERILPTEFLLAFLAPPQKEANTNNSTPTRPAAAPAVASGGRYGDGSVGRLMEVPMDRVEAWVARQSPALLRHWAILRGEAPPLSSEEGGRSKSDWVLALCLAEMLLSVEQIAWVLHQLPGSKAAERGSDYALLTARKAVTHKASYRRHARAPEAVSTDAATA